MNSYLVLIISVCVLIFAMAKLGMPLSEILKASKLPAWAKFRVTDPWGNPWIDSHPQLKNILIKFGQGILVSVLFFINFLLFTAKAAGKAFVKAIESSAKGATKKITK